MNKFVNAADEARAERNWALAARLYAEAVAEEPDLADIWVQLGHALKESGDLPAAEEAYRTALRLKPTADTFLQLGHLLKISRRLDEACVAYESCVCFSSASADAFRELKALRGSDLPPLSSARISFLESEVEALRAILVGQQVGGPRA